MNLTNGFTKESFKEIRTCLQKHFDDIKKETGIDFSIGNIRFEPDNFTTTLTGKVNAGSKEEENQKEWNKYCRNFGLMPDWFGKEFQSGGKVFVIYGIKKYADTRPVLAYLKQDPSKKFVFPSTVVIPQFLTKTDKFEI